MGKDKFEDGVEKTKAGLIGSARIYIETLEKAYNTKGLTDAMARMQRALANSLNAYNLGVMRFKLENKIRHYDSFLEDVKDIVEAGKYKTLRHQCVIALEDIKKEEERLSFEDSRLG